MRRCASEPPTSRFRTDHWLPRSTSPSASSIRTTPMASIGSRSPTFGQRPPATLIDASLSGNGSLVLPVEASFLPIGNSETITVSLAGDLDPGETTVSFAPGSLIEDVARLSAADFEAIVRSGLDRLPQLVADALATAAGDLPFVGDRLAALSGIAEAVEDAIDDVGDFATTGDLVDRLTGALGTPVLLSLDGASVRFVLAIERGFAGRRRRLGRPRGGAARRRFRLRRRRARAGPGDGLVGGRDRPRSGYCRWRAGGDRRRGVVLCRARLPDPDARTSRRRRAARSGSCVDDGRQPHGRRGRQQRLGTGGHSGRTHRPWRTTAASRSATWPRSHPPTSLTLSHRAPRRSRRSCRPTTRRPATRSPCRSHGRLTARRRSSRWTATRWKAS